MKTRWLVVAFIAFFSSIHGLAAQENEWPRRIDAPKATIVIYQPQPETFQDNHLTARSAVSVTMKDDPEPVFGAAWYDATVATDRDARMVEVQNVKVTKVKFPDATPEQEQKFIDLVSREMTGWKLNGSLDRLMTTLELAKKEEKIAGQGNTTPPKILYSEQPAVLVTIDGNPILKAVAGSEVQQVVNTPFQIFFDPTWKLYYLKGSPQWFSSSDLMGGWKVLQEVPESISKLATAAETSDNTPSSSKIPQILVATEPTELIVSDGEPQWEAIPGTDLSYLKNSSNAAFFQPAAGTYYVMLSGRWFSTKSTPPAVAASAPAPLVSGLWGKMLSATKPPAKPTVTATLSVADAFKGPWTYVSPDQLPEGFRKIPPSFSQGSVLASIPGTQEAEDAAMDAEIPQTTVIDKKKASFKATYDGEPKFEKVSGTSMDYAVNTPDQIIKDGDKYYAVDQGVWYVADKPEGPYKVADKRPKDIDQIPPDNPNYNTKYVYVYDSDDDTVTSGYTAGYLGAFLIGTTMGAAMTWGTGYYYRPWYGSYYYSRPWSYGYGAYYNSNTGGWGYRGPNGGAWYRPSGGYYGGNGYWGAGGYRNIDVGDINVGEININRDRTTNNLYNRQNNLNRNADSGRLAQRDKNQLNKLGERGPSAGRDSSKLAGDRPNNVFADKDGNVFQRNQDGKWQERQGKEWKDTEVPQGLKDKAASREAGGLSDKDQGMKDRQPGESGLKDKAGGLKDNKVQGKDLSDKAGNLKARNPNPSAKQGQLANRPAAANRQPANFDRGNMERQHQARDHGNARAQNYQSYQSNRNMASRPSSGGTDRGGGGNLNRGGGGSRGGGGFQGGGGGGGRSRGGGGGGRRR